ncbi:MAG: class I SAM-dependent methyltransferase [bacterium]
MDGRNFYTASNMERERNLQIQKSESGIAEKYLKSCQTDFWQQTFRFELDCILQRLSGGEEILSVGCGPAIIESALIERGFRITGMDVSREALKHAPDDVGTVAARAEDMPFPESSFDAVIYVASLQFIENYKKAIKETTRVLRPHGKLIVLLLNPESDFFKKKLHEPDSYVQKIIHKDLREIEGVINERFNVHTEYKLGVKNDSIFESRDAADAILYIVTGAKKHEKEDKDA